MATTKITPVGAPRGRTRAATSERDVGLRIPSAVEYVESGTLLFWLPLVLGGAAFVSLRRGVQDPSRPDLCDPFLRPQVVP